MFRFSYSALQFQSFHLSFTWPLNPRFRGTAITGKQQNRMPSTYYCSSSQQEDEQEIISDGISAMAGGIVAFGKFDAMHIGHRELVIQASSAGPPFLLSFVGMAKVLGWEQRYEIV